MIKKNEYYRSGNIREVLISRISQIGQMGFMAISIFNINKKKYIEQSCL